MMTDDRADLVNALTQHGIWLRDNFPGHRQHEVGIELLQLAEEVESMGSGPLPPDLRARLQSWLPGIYRAQLDDDLRTGEDRAYHERLSRLSAAIERLAPRDVR
jgi:hypothetical protein